MLLVLTLLQGQEVSAAPEHRARSSDPSPKAAPVLPGAPRPEVKAQPVVRPRRTGPEPAYLKLVRPNRRVDGSISLGTSSQGRLAQSAALPHVGKHHAVLPRWRVRHTNFGTDELITLLLHAAARVAQTYPGSRLMLGNLSFRNGGDIPWSVSHNSGRDADLAFYARRRTKPVLPTGLWRFGPTLRSLNPTGFRFDVPRNWALVKALISHPTIQVQWLFISTPLRAALLRYATARREAGWIVSRAAHVLRQPGDSRSHNDHLHLRLYCSRQDRLEGCFDYGPRWAGIKCHDPEVEARIRVLVPGLQDPEPAVRLGVIAYLVRLRARHSINDIARHGLRDPDPRVRTATLSTIIRWKSDSDEVLRALTHLIRRPGAGVLAPDPSFELPIPRTTPDLFQDQGRTGEQLRLAYRALSGLRSWRTIPLLRRALVSHRIITGKNGRGSVPEALLAAQAARALSDLRLAPALVKALDRPNSLLRQTAALALRRITNHTFGCAWHRKMSPRGRHRNARRWQRWWRQHRHWSRERLVRLGFRRVNRRLRSLKSRRATRTLVAYTKRNDHLGYNAHRMLRVLTHQQPKRALYTADSRYRYWHAWYQRKERLRLERLRAARRKRLAARRARRLARSRARRRRRVRHHRRARPTRRPTLRPARRPTLRPARRR